MNLNSNKHFKSIVIVLLLVLVGQPSFAQGDEGWFKRNWSNMVSRYNIYFNAKQLVDRAATDLEQGHKDNFSDMIAVFPEGTEADGQGQTATLEEAMKKCSRIIQDKSNSKWVDDSYLLIGKAHYYKGDPFASLEMFQYVYSLYKDRPIHYEAQLWILKSKIKMGKLNEAEALYSLIKQDKTFPDGLKTELLLTAGSLYTLERKYSTARDLLKEAWPGVKKRNQKYRVHFLLGQLNLALGETKEANFHFVKCIRQTPPYDYAFQANLGIASSSFGGDNENLKTAKKYLNRMLKDDKNIDYFDQIYYQLGQINLKEGNRENAITQFKKSTASTKGNKIQLTDGYLALANLYFEEENFQYAQKYFDSASSVVEENHPKYKDIITQQAVLSDLVDQLVTINKEDSLLELATIPREQLDRLVDELIASDRKKAAAEKEAAEKAKEEEYFNQLYNQNNPNNPNNPNQQVATGNGTDWYFYNTMAKARGFSEFTRVWGSRKYGDWWRMSAKKATFDAPNADPDPDDEDPEEVANNVLTYNAEQDAEKQEILSNIQEDRRKYYEDIPFSKAGKAVAHARLETALFDVSKIYKDKLNNCEDHNLYLNRLVAEYPKSLYKPEAYFMLHKCYSEDSATGKAAAIEDAMVKEFPNSNFTAVVTERELPSEAGENKEVISNYEAMYMAFKAGKYEDAKNIKLKNDAKFSGNSLQAKFDYLFALCTAKTDSLGAYKENLNYLVESYPGTEIAEMAQRSLDQFKPKVEEDPNAVRFDKEQGTHYVVFTMNEGGFKQIGAALSDFNKQYYTSNNLKVQNTILGESDFAWIKEFKTPIAAMQYLKTVQNNDKIMGKPEMNNARLYVIGEGNFKKLLMEQDDFSYYQFFKKAYQ